MRLIMNILYLRTSRVLSRSTSIVYLSFPLTTVTELSLLLTVTGSTTFWSTTEGEEVKMT